MKTPIYLIIATALTLIISCNPNPGADRNTNLVVTKGHDTDDYAPELPPPNVQKRPNTLFSKIAKWGKNAPKAPDCFVVQRFAENLDNPRWMYVTPHGDILVAEASRGENAPKRIGGKLLGRNKSAEQNESRIILLRDTDKDGYADMRKIFLPSLNMPFGMLMLNGYFYVANTDGLWRFPLVKNEVRIISSGQKIMELPGGKRHWTRGLITNENGSKLYISVGSASDHGEDGPDAETNRACIIEVNPDGTQPRLFAQGLRNPVGIQFYPGTNDLWAVVCERDGLGDGLVPDYFTRVKRDGFYGWPFSYYGKYLDPRVEVSAREVEMVKRSIVPDVNLGAHVTPLGLAFYDGKFFPPEYWGGAFIAEHGSWNSTELVGYKVVFVPFKDGKPGKPQDFLTGFVADAKTGNVFGRPTGIVTLPDGSILVSDDASNCIWRISYSRE